MSSVLRSASFFFRIVGYNVSIFYAYWRRTRARAPPISPMLLASTKPLTVVIVGGSFAGHSAARSLATSLPPNTPHRIILVEPNSHFQFTWVLPRFCVVSGYEDKAFIPYGAHVPEHARHLVTYVHDRVVGVTSTHVQLQDAGPDGAIRYDFLVLATGAGAGDALPSRVGTEDKINGVERLRDMQAAVGKARRVVVAGGGAAGVEFAADAKEKYPNKSVTLVHSRAGVMNRFGLGLQMEALRGLQSLGVEVILEDRLVQENKDDMTVTLKSGKVLPCDLLVNCAGQKPTTAFLGPSFSPKAIPPHGRILVKPTMQIDDDNLPNVYACGDVAECSLRNTNSRTAMKQADVVADNIAMALDGKEPGVLYKPHWGDALIKLTLGLKKAVVYFSDGTTEMLFRSNNNDEALDVQHTWAYLGYPNFEDADYEKQRAGEVV
ncbi:hypothetical protein TD95_001660 [Thielaviopsis punctulata]|uniref:FAD/NAD(P)-binding domain-containing protein n=1 Tax=Thielaviopsis punctulata TaxID=72032 RepID=A0A0F4ZG93_9PEZI|nr:hypothetical protein TD95_001660 [Thielaviopsis punctulata]